MPTTNLGDLAVPDCVTNSKLPSEFTDTELREALGYFTLRCELNTAPNNSFLSLDLALSLGACMIEARARNLC